MILYHIDRNNLLSEGLVLTPEINPFPDWPECVSLCNDFFPNGVSKHGAHFLQTFSSNNFEMINSSIIDIIFELVRRCEFPSMPSRYESLFALKSPNEITLWPELLTSGLNIYQIEIPDDGFVELDANNLHGGIAPGGDYHFLFSPTMMINDAKKYWSGHLTESPRMECLIPLPVTVGKKISIQL